MSRYSLSHYIMYSFTLWKNSQLTSVMNYCNRHLACRLFQGTVSYLIPCKPSSVLGASRCMSHIASVQRWQKYEISSSSPTMIAQVLKKTGTRDCMLFSRRPLSESKSDASERATTKGFNELAATLKKEDKDLKATSPEDGDSSTDVLSNRKLSLVDLNAVPEDEFEDVENSQEFEVDILEETEQPKVLAHFSELPLMPETYTLASYVDHSETLQKLVQMGVDLSKVQSRKGVASMLMKMDFDRDIKDKLAFLHHSGVPGEKLGSFITKNPFILGEDVQNLEARVHYLLQKGFSEADVAQIVCRAPYFLNFSVERIDNKLGYYQQLLRFPDSQIKEIITRCPKLVTMKVSRPKENLFVLEFQCGFSKDALHSMVRREPAILLRGKFRLIATFDYLHNVMEIPHKIFLKSPQIFLGQVNRVKDRHKYLELLGRNQYDPTEPGYVPLIALFKLPDEAFCKDIAKTSLEEYDRFLKTSRT